MTEPGEPLKLDYANDTTSGDVVAERVLVRVLWWILGLQFVGAGIGLAFGVNYLLQDSTVLDARVAFAFVLAILQFVLFGICLRELSRRRRSVVFLITFVVGVLQNLLYLPSANDSAIHTAMILAGSLVHGVVMCVHLLMPILLFGRGSSEWLMRLNLLAIAMLALSQFYWLRSNLLRLLDPDSRLVPDQIFIRPDWQQAGTMVAAIALLLMRREYNRILIRLVTAWSLLVYAIQLYDMFFQRWTTYQFEPIELVGLFVSVKYWFISNLPLAFLVWFTFRFTDAQRREMGRKLVQAEAIGDS